MIGISIIRETTSCAGIVFPKRIICIGILSLGLTGSDVASKVRVQDTRYGELHISLIHCWSTWAPMDSMDKEYK
jgi:hypothetical protein